MKTLDQVTDDKLRGGFYTPPDLVELCLSRIDSLVGTGDRVRVLEPSVGDGAFIRGLARNPLGDRVEQVVALEVDDIEADKARSEGNCTFFPVSVLLESAVQWAARTEDLFDAAVGNPPFVRFQFIGDSDVLAVEQLGMRLGIEFRGVGNLWIPVLLGAASRVKVGGAIAFVVPTELFTGVSAGAARRWLLANYSELRIDLFEPGSFPGVLQEVIVLSGRRAATRNEGSAAVEFVEHDPGQIEVHWSHSLETTARPWTQFLLAPRQLAAYQTLRECRAFQPLAAYARIEVSIVTGANEFFSVSRSEVQDYGLEPWAVPLLPRTRHADGLRFTIGDHELLLQSGAPAWLLSFDEHRPNPQEQPKARAYLERGERQDLHRRYKTGIRSPWYRVPSVWAGALLLSKRCHRFPRLIVNEAEVVTTDTIYRGVMHTAHIGREPALAGSFHNSATLLTAELEGRSFGGGVLELVPSEVARLLVPFTSFTNDDLIGLDAIARATDQGSDEECLIDATDQLLLQRVPEISADLLECLRGARRSLLGRRLKRN
ncbi:MAG: SAM-dependent methyltransferase [Anaerolinea sp.]|nr:SAM-dependent methyltransferase [Anaerolinea sp.]